MTLLYSAAIVIAVGDRDVGLALRGPDAYGFVAADPRFRLLEGSRFRRLEQVQSAAQRLARALDERQPDQAKWTEPFLTRDRETPQRAA